MSEEERNSGVIMHRSAKPSRQCAKASKNANSTVGMHMIRRTLVTRDKNTLLRLYKTLVRPQLEYCIQVSIPETGYGKTGESANKSHESDSGL